MGKNGKKRKKIPPCGIKNRHFENVKRYNHFVGIFYFYGHLRKHAHDFPNVKVRYKVIFVALKTRAGYPKKISKGESKKQRNFTKGSNKQGILLNPNEVQITLNALNKHGRLMYLLSINS